MTLTCWLWSTDLLECDNINQALWITEEQLQEWRKELLSNLDELAKVGIVYEDWEWDLSKSKRADLWPKINWRLLISFPYTKFNKRHGIWNRLWKIWSKKALIKLLKILWFKVIEYCSDKKIVSEKYNDCFQDKEWRIVDLNKAMVNLKIEELLELHIKTMISEQRREEEKIKNRKEAEKVRREIRDRLICCSKVSIISPWNDEEDEDEDELLKELSFW